MVDAGSLPVGLHCCPPGTSASSETSIQNSCMEILTTANATHYSTLETGGKCHDFLAALKAKWERGWGSQSEHSSTLTCWK